MTTRKLGEGASSPYCAFKDDRERKWALVSRDIRWVLVAAVWALAGIPLAKWQALWRLIVGG
jgi:hypothetical protein